MIWVRVWARSNCASGLNEEHETYYPFAKDQSDDCLKDYAREFGEEWNLDQSERGYKYGFERIPVLDDATRKKLIDIYEKRVKAAEAAKINHQAILNTLLEKPVSVETRHERVLKEGDK